MAESVGGRWRDHRWPLLSVAFAVGVAEAIRHSRLLTTWLKDQAAIHAVAADLVGGRLDSPFPMPYTTALYHGALAAGFAVTGEGVLGPRVLAAALVVLTVGLCYALAARWTSPWAAAFAASMCAWSPLFLGLPVVGIPNDPSLLLIAVLCWAHGVEQSEPRRAATWYVFAGLVLGGSLYLRFFLGPMAAALILLLPWTAPAGQRFRSLLLAGVSAVLISLPFFGVLLASDAGRDVRAFLDWSSGDEATMHTTLKSVGRPFLERAQELWRSVAGVLMGTMDVGGPVPRRFPNVLALVLSTLAALWITPQAVRGRSMGARFLFVWIAAATAVLLFVYAWPAEGEGGPAHRAPRYLVVLFPAPWIALALVLDDVRRRWPILGRRGAVASAALVLGSDLAGHTAPTAIRLLREPSTALDGAAAAINEVIEAERARTGRAPVLLLDAPLGDARRWAQPRFPLDRQTFLAALPPGPPRDPRLMLMLRFPQMVYQAQPDTYRLTWEAPGGPVPTLLSLGHQPLPPMRPLEVGAELSEERWPLVVVLSSSRAERLLDARMGPAGSTGEAERIRRFQQLQPGTRSARTLNSTLGPVVAIHPIELRSRRFREAEIWVGTEREMLSAPDRIWLVEHLLFAPWLGYGFDHALVESAEAIQLPGLRAPLPVTVKVAVVPGRVRVEVERLSPLAEQPGPLQINAQVAAPSGSATVSALVQSWSHGAEVEAPDGMVEVRLFPSGDGRNPWTLRRIRVTSVQP